MRCNINKFYYLIKKPNEFIFLLKRPFKIINELLLFLGIKIRILRLERIVLTVNNYCNASCLMCDIGQGNDRGLAKAVNSFDRILDLSLIRKILNDPYIRFRSIQFVVLMTEPLLHPQIGIILREIKNKGHRLVISTNGILLLEKSEELQMARFDKNDYLQVSLDGPLEINNKIRGKETYKKAIKGIKELKSKSSNINIIICFTVFDLNYKYLVNFINSIENEGISICEIRFQFIFFVSRKMIEGSKSHDTYDFTFSESTISKDLNFSTINIKELREELNKIRKVKLEHVKKVRIMPDLTSEYDLNKYFDLSGEALRRYKTCLYPYEQIAIDCDGKVLFHTRCIHYSLGSVKDQGIKNIFHGEAASHFRKILKAHEFCLPVCTRCCGVLSKIN